MRAKTHYLVIFGILGLAISTGTLVLHSANTSGSKNLVNDLCFVCHLDMKTEEISTVHQAEDIGCDQCHGPSEQHMHDEMLMTKPDRLYGRTEVEAMCKKCHQDTHEEPGKVSAFRQKWMGKRRSNGRVINTDSVCTDCHGAHNIIKKMGIESEEESLDWKALFNGRDLTRWQTKGDGDWSVKRDRIIAELDKKAKTGALWTDSQYDNYKLVVTFQAEWPLHAGIYLRSENGPRVEIFQDKKANAFTGSITLPDKGIALLNYKENLFDPGGWNTLSLDVNKNLVRIWLNGEEIGAVRIPGPEKGKIGLSLEKAPGQKTAQLTIREVLLQKIE